MSKMTEIFENLTALAREGTLTAKMLLEQMVEDRKTADSYDPTDYDSRIEANVAWWCLNPETRLQLLGLTKDEQGEIARAILSESAWGPAFFCDFEPEVFDWLAELTNQQDVFMAGIGMIGKTRWIEWAITHFPKDKVRAIVFHCLQEQPQAAEEFFGGRADNWSATFWSLFDTPERFVAAVQAAIVHRPERLLTRWAYVGACLTQMSRGLSIESFEYSWDFLPHERKDALKLATPSMELIEPLVRFALEQVGDGERISPSFLRPLPLDLRLTALEHVTRLGEGVELSIDLLFDLPREDARSEQVLEELLSRMTARNAPFVYIHALACRMEKGDTVYTRYKTTRAGRHHASRGQREIWDERREDTKEVLLKSLVTTAWFYPHLRERLIECGWEFISRETLEYRTDRSFGQRYVRLGETTLVLSFLHPADKLQWLHLEAGLDLIVPTRPWRQADRETDLHGTRYLDFEGLTPIFDAPLHMDLFHEFEKKATEKARRR